MKQTFRCIDSKGRGAVTVHAFGAVNAARMILDDPPALLRNYTEDDIIKRLQVLDDTGTHPVWSWARYPRQS